MRGERPRSPETKSFREIFLNKWTALAVIAAGVLMLKLGEGKSDAEREQIGRDIENTLHLDAGDIPSNSAEQQEVLDAVDTLNELLNKKRIEDARIDDEKYDEQVEGEIVESVDKVADGEMVEEGKDKPVIEQKEEEEDIRKWSSERFIEEYGPITNTEVHEDSDEMLSLFHTHEDGTKRFEVIDKTLPDHVTTTDEDYKNFQEFLSDGFENFSVDRIDSWKYELKDNKTGRFTCMVQAMEDGGYKVGASSVDQGGYVPDLDSLGALLTERERVRTLMELSDGGDSNALDELMEIMTKNTN